MDQQASARVDPLRLLRRIAVNRWRSLLVGLLVVALPTTAGVFLFAPHMYEATATLFLVPSKEEPPFMREFIASDANALYLVMLRSRSLAQAVVDSLPRESRDELIQNQLLGDYMLLVMNRVRRLLGRDVIVYSPQEMLVRELREARMSFAISKDGTVHITAVAFHSRVATDLANSYVEVLLARSAATAREQARMTRELIGNLTAQAQTGQLEAEDALRKFQEERGGGLNLPEHTKLELKKLSELESALSDLQVNREIAQARLGFLRGEPQRAGKLPPASPDIMVQPLRERLAGLEAKLAALGEKYTDEHPRVRSTETEIQEVQERLRVALETRQAGKPPLGSGAMERAIQGRQMAALEVGIMSLQAKEETVKHRIGRVKRSLSALSTHQQEYSGLARSVETQRKLVGLLSEKLMAARINEQGNIRSIRLIDQAAIPREPSPKQWLKVLVLGVLAGVGLGGGLAGLREYAYEVLETEEDVVRASGLPVLGSIPRARRSGRTPVGEDGPVNFLEGGGIASLPAEACRTTRTALESEGVGRKLRTLLITSPGTGEGKTTVLVNLGWAFTERDCRLLLVDADLRRPSLHRALNIPNELGLADMLQDGALWPAGCRRLSDRCDFIPSGTKTSNPGALLSSGRMAELLRHARGEADVILLDSPPVLAVADNLALTALVDGIVLVVRSGQTRRRSLLRAKAQLERVRARIVGVIVNGLSPRETRRYYAEYTDYLAGGTAARRRRGKSHAD